MFVFRSPLNTHVAVSFRCLPPPSNGYNLSDSLSNHDPQAVRRLEAQLNDNVASQDWTACEATQVEIEAALAEAELRTTNHRLTDALASKRYGECQQLQKAARRLEQTATEKRDEAQLISEGHLDPLDRLEAIDPASHAASLARTVEAKQHARVASLEAKLDAAVMEAKKDVIMRKVATPPPMR